METRIVSCKQPNSQLLQMTIESEDFDGVNFEGPKGNELQKKVIEYAGKQGLQLAGINSISGIYPVDADGKQATTAEELVKLSQDEQRKFRNDITLLSARPF